MPAKKRNRKEAELEASLEDEYRNITDEELRKALLEIGENPGPIDATNRRIYIRLLVRKRIKTSTENETTTSTAPPSKKSSPLTKSVTVSTKKVSYSPPVSTYVATSSLTAIPTMKLFDIRGLTAATFTPFTPDGEVNLSLIKSYADFLLKQAVTNVFVNGTTGEGVSLTVEERKLVAEEWIKVAGRKMTVIIHVGTMSLKSTCDLARHAEIHNAAAISLIPPSYFKPPNLESLVLYLQKVGESAPRTPMLYYHIPSMTGVRFPMTELLESASVHIPTFRGLKYTDMNLAEFSQCVAFDNRKYPVLYGTDEQLIGALSMGGTAAVGSTYNYCGRLNNRLFKAFNEGDMDTALIEQRKSLDTIKILKDYSTKVGQVAAGKAIMKARGLDVGPPRLPFLPLTGDDYSSLVSELRSIGFMEWA